MSIKVGQAFERTSANPIDESLALTKAKMLTVNDNLMPAYYFTICQDDGKLYLYDKSSTASVTTGKFKEFSGGSGGGAEIYTTTDTLNSDINGTKTVLAADLPGVSFSDLKVGSSIIKDDKGTLGIVTAITGTTSVTVTTATTSTPTKELTQAQYDALVLAGTVDPDTIYFITDGVSATYYIGGDDSIFSTEERVIGSWLGKPLYQITIPLASTTNDMEHVDATDLNIDQFIDGFARVWLTSGSNNEYITVVHSNGTDKYIGYYASGKYFYGQHTNTATSKRWEDITVRYTKTSDPATTVGYATPNEYSTTEKIVGHWVDGKPLYQITLPKKQLLNNTAVTWDISSLHVKDCIKIEGWHTDNTAYAGVVQIAPSANDTVFAWHYKANSEIHCQNTYSSYAGRDVWITIQYTKETN